MNNILSYLNRTTMYMVVVHMLLVLWVVTLTLSLMGTLAYPPLAILLSTAVLVVSALATSLLFSVVGKVPAQHLSSVITALILFFLFTPNTDGDTLGVLAIAAAAAVLTKYAVVWRKQHIVNPAAAGAVVVGFLGIGGATWWVASTLLVVPVALAVALIATKVRKWPMVLMLLGVGFLTFWFEELRFGNDITETWSLFFVQYPALFLAGFMVTEPFTMPGRERQQLLYAALIGFFTNTALFLSWFVLTPELVLVAANVMFFVTTVRQKLFLTLQSKKEITPRIWEFTFTKPQGMRFAAGQYMEWMLPHRQSDGRGIRRYFTITSAPHEAVLRLACKVPDEASTYKQALLALAPGATVVASQRGGDFTLPLDPSEKLGWIAGGIGVTPFVSQAAHLRMTGEQRDIVAFYATATASDAAYGAELEVLARVVGVVSQGDVPPGGESGYVTADMIRRQVPDAATRTWYISGPPAMVTSAKAALLAVHVPRRRIKTDFFPGLA